MRTRLTALITALLLTPLLVVLVPAPVFAADLDCPDFDNQAQAQAFFDSHDPSSDPHRLDADHDGIACESLPCPCSTGSDPDPDPEPSKPVIRQVAYVRKVLDGDTIDVRVEGTGFDIRVQMLGSNAPEIGACGGFWAARTLRSFLPLGARVVITSDPTQNYNDRYGRRLRYVQRGDRDVNKAQLWRGAARVIVYSTPFKRITAYRATEASAKENNRGLWAVCW